MADADARTDEMPRLLSSHQLDDLEKRWRDHGLPGAADLNPGLSDDEIDSTFSAAGLQPSDEARTWWGWHNGGTIESMMLTPGYAFWNLAKCVEAYLHHWEMCEKDAERYGPEESSGIQLGARSHFPISWCHGYLALDTNVPEGEPSPIYHAEGHDYDYEGLTEPKLGSFSNLVALWIKAFDSGWFVYSVSTSRFKNSVPVGVAPTGMLL